MNGTIGSLGFAIIGTCNHGTDDTFKVSLEHEDHIAIS
ncbi:hypothetical protein EVA_12492 [gut metagenome]|uniref:Uncharacterized protein n=1 Tax=gut metagenome TaxID=749906 RepID=J9FWP4_9ZZZZ